MEHTTQAPAYQAPVVPDAGDVVEVTRGTQNFDTADDFAPVVTGPVAEYEPPAAVRAGTLVALAAGTYSDGQQDDGDYHTTKWHA